MPHAVTLEIMALLDTIRAQIGVSYLTRSPRSGHGVASRAGLPVSGWDAVRRHLYATRPDGRRHDQPAGGQRQKSGRTRKYTRQAIAPAPGKVSTQAITMLPATPQRTAESRFVAPTPMIAEVIVWVVEIGGRAPAR